MNTPHKSLVSDLEFRKDIESRMTHAVYGAISNRLPVSADEVGFILRHLAINHRFDVTRCGQDISDSRLNLFTDGKGTVIRMHIG